MKFLYKIYIEAKENLTEDQLDAMRPYLDNYTDRLLIDKLEIEEENPKIASIILSYDDNGYPEQDEVTLFTLAVEDWGEASVHYGYPSSENIVYDSHNGEIVAENLGIIGECQLHYA